MLNKISISYEVLFLLCISSQIASGLACYVREHKLNFRNREMLEKRKTHPFREIEASLSQIWLKPDNSGVSLWAATADGGVIRAEVIDGAKSSQFTKWGRKYLPGTAWEGRTAGGKSPCGSTFSDHKTGKQEIRRIPILKLRLAVEWLNKKRHLKRCLFYLVILVTPRPDDHIAEKR